MSEPLTIGTATANPARLVYGTWDHLTHPTGHPETWPVVIAQGERPGPTVWLSANIHGGELTGTAVLFAILDRLDLQALRGTLVCLPTLNPAGLRVQERAPYFDRRDPNRTFPNPAPAQPSDDRDEPADPLEALVDSRRHQTPFERAAAALYARLVETADAYLDLHCAVPLGLPLVFVDPVFHARTPEDAAAASEVHARTERLALATGLTVVRESPGQAYTRDNLHRSSTGAVLNGARIPAITLELGMSRAVDPAARDAGIAALGNALRHLGMLPGEPDPARVTDAGVPVIPSPPAWRHVPHPRAPGSGYALFVKKPGDRVRAGDTIAELRDLWGRPVGANRGRVTSEYDGAILWLRAAGCVYENQPLCVFAVADPASPVLPWPV